MFLWLGPSSLAPQLLGHAHAGTDEPAHAIAAAPEPGPGRGSPSSAPPAAGEPPYVVRTRARSPRLARYLGRDLSASGRFVDHGVIELSTAGGYPHRYRLGATIGLLDHLSIGATAHWLPSAKLPRLVPRVALAIYRWPWFEIGAAYDRTLYPATPPDDDPMTPSYQRDAHWFLAALAFSQSWVSAGAEFGVTRARETDPAKPVGSDNLTPARWVNRFGGGVFLRAGTRRWGFTASARGPWVFAELALDIRLGAFELRPRGGWRPAGLARATDRRAPTRR